MMAFQIILGIYLMLMLVFVTCWWLYKKPGKYITPGKFYSIIVPCRNEAQNIGTLLKCLGELTFPKRNFEVIVVDDHSTDGTTQVVGHFIDNGSDYRLRLISLNIGEGKKAALKEGIKNAQGAIIITTDADCQVQPNWLNSFVRFFELQNARLVFGGVGFNTKSFFSRLQAIEFLSLIGSGAVTLKMRRPTMCNGANLAFTKAIFYEVDGYKGNEHLASGDDGFLMHKVYGKYPELVFFNKSSRAVVFTRPNKNIYDFYHQRVRWASKWSAHDSKFTAFIAGFVFFANLVWVILYAYSFFNLQLWVLGLFGLKVLMEGVFLFSISSSLKVSFHPVEFLLLEVIYPIYVVFFSVAANFGSYTWKDRKY